jgi:hypothetical protein
VDAIAMLVCLALGGGVTWWRYKYGTRDSTGFMPRADAEFRQILITDAPPEFCFDGRSAEIVAEGRSYTDKYQTTINSVTRYARNGRGEYFFFLSEGTGRPLFKHIEQRAARAALGRKYIAPPGAR